MDETVGVSDAEFDKQVVAAVFDQAGLTGWSDVTLVGAARDAGLDLVRVRRRFPNRTAVLLKFGSLADQEALAQLSQAGTPRERLFDLLMARFDMMQRHRAGVLSVMDSLKFDPGLALLLGGATLRSMRWLLEAAEVPSRGVVGLLRVQGLGAVWAYAVRAWEKDETADMASVMAAIDRALDRAVQAEGMLPGRSSAAPEPPPFDAAPFGTPAAGMPGGEAPLFGRPSGGAMPGEADGSPVVM